MANVALLRRQQFSGFAEPLADGIDVERNASAFKVSSDFRRPITPSHLGVISIRGNGHSNYQLEKAIAGTWAYLKFWPVFLRLLESCNALLKVRNLSTLLIGNLKPIGMLFAKFSSCLVVQSLPVGD